MKYVAVLLFVLKKTRATFCTVLHAFVQTCFGQSYLCDTKLKCGCRNVLLIFCVRHFFFFFFFFLGAHSPAHSKQQHFLILFFNGIHIYSLKHSTHITTHNIIQNQNLLSQCQFTRNFVLGNVLHGENRMNNRLIF